MSDLFSIVETQLSANICWQTQPSLCVAYSGGVDSHVLLHVLKRLQVQGMDFALQAVHVDHQLQAQSVEWARHCDAVCRALDVPLLSFSVDIPTDNSDSMEALARAARYHTFKTQLPENTVLLTAHHQDDQAETVLLQLLRGAGPKGLSAMPVMKPLGALHHFRPFLSVSKSQLLAYAKTHQLHWVEDASNHTLDFHRNVIRHEVLPLIQKTWPSACETLSRSAAHCAETQGLLDTLAQADYQQCQGPQQTVLVDCLLALPTPRAKQVIRYWLVQRGLALPSTAQLTQILQELLPAKQDAMPLVQWSDVTIRRYRNVLYANPPLETIDVSKTYSWPLQTAFELPATLGSLTAEKTQGQGIKVSEVGDCLEVRFRQGGETCHLPNRFGAHSLKNLFQEWGVPPWERDRIPLLYANNQLVCVFGFCVCDGFQASNNDPAWKITKT